MEDVVKVVRMMGVEVVRLVWLDVLRKAERRPGWLLGSLASVSGR